MLNRMIWNKLYPRLYSLVIIGINLLPAKNKLKVWLRSRDKDILIAPSFRSDKTTLLFVCASLGEYEMVKSLILRLRKMYNIHLSFFSTSGYNRLIHLPDSYDILSYTPLDKRNALNIYFSEHLSAAVIIAGNELWPQFMNYLLSHQIPYLYVGFTLKRDSFLHHWFVNSHRHVLMNAKVIFTHALDTAEYLKNLEIHNLTITSHPRLHTIIQDATEVQPDKKLINFTENHRILVMGSTHPKDERLLLKVIDRLRADIKIIIVPHDIDHYRIAQLQKRLQLSEIWSKMSDLGNCKVLIIDELGLLKSIYSLATVSYIGGGFDKGIHNMLEAAIYNRPIIIGPRYEKFTEVIPLMQAGLVRSISNDTEFLKVVNEMMEAQADHLLIDQSLQLETVDADLDKMIETISSLI